MIGYFTILGDFRGKNHQFWRPEIGNPIIKKIANNSKTVLEKSSNRDNQWPPGMNELLLYSASLAITGSSENSKSYVTPMWAVYG